MGNRGHNRHGPKREGGRSAPFTEELGPSLTQCGLGRGLLLYQVASSSIQPFGHMATWAENRGLCPLFGEGSWVPMQHNVRDEAYLHTNWHLDSCSRLAAIDISQNCGAPPLFREGARFPSNTKSPGLRLTSIPTYQVAS